MSLSALLSQAEKDLINQIMVETGTIQDCVMAVFVRRLQHLTRATIYHDIPAYSALVINTRAQVREYIGKEWDDWDNLDG